MAGWHIIVDRPEDFPSHSRRYKVIATRDYLARRDAQAPRLINLSGSYAYQSMGYYASLLAGARGHLMMPGVETILQLREGRADERALSDLEDELNRCAWSADIRPKRNLRLMVCFGMVRDQRFDTFGRLLFERFRAPALEVAVRPGQRLKIDRISLRTPGRLAKGDAAFLHAALHQHIEREERGQQGRPTRYSLAVLYDPHEKTPPSSVESIKHLARVAKRLSVDVQPLTRRQLPQLAKCDGLFIRETTSIGSHTYRFACRAWEAGMPVIDDPLSIVRCTNKVFVAELLASHRVPIPLTVFISRQSDLTQAADQLGLPLVVKIPDGAFSRGVHKVATLEQFKTVSQALFAESDLLLAQKFLPTEFDWRVGVLANEPLFVCQYRMARGHWQVVKYWPDGSSREGGFRAYELDRVPREVIDIALRATRPIGDGFYGVDLKQTDHGIAVMEVNDNPNLEHGIEDRVSKDEIWIKLLQWFIDRSARLDVGKALARSRTAATFEHALATD